MAKKTARKRTSRGPGIWPGVAVAAKFVLPLLAAAGLVVGVVLLARAVGPAIADRDRYTVRIADLHTDAPPVGDPRAFLTEVRYLGALPESVQTVDPQLSSKLTAAFRKHPWVADVTAVTVGADGGVHVGLKFRTPALLIRLVGNEWRAVDPGGVLLPADAPTAGLPRFLNPQLPHDTPAGQVWPDPDVRRALELIVDHPAKELERLPTGWRVTRADGQVLVIAAP